MARKSANRETFENLGDSVNKELATGPSAGGLDSNGKIASPERLIELLIELNENHSTTLIEITRELNRTNEVNLKAALDKAHPGEKNTSSTSSKPSPQKWLVTAVLSCILACLIFCIIAAINPMSFLPSEIQIMAGKTIVQAPIAIIGIIIGKLLPGGKD